MLFPWCGVIGLDSECHKKMVSRRVGFEGECPRDACNGWFRRVSGNSVTGEIPERAGQAEGRVGKGPEGGGRGRTQIL